MAHKEPLYAKNSVNKVRFIVSTESTEKRALLTGLLTL